ncbi:MAG TPA: NHL repeat-containing protein, partial [Lapillicoccus sp.]|nr:NHL repeat-containing protein [Lapillicoccus sp.]
AEHAAKGTLRRGSAPYAPPPPPESRLRFPGKVALLPDGSFVVSDTAHHQVVHLEADLETERRRWGGAGSFDEPQGVLLLPAPVAADVGYDLLVADSVNHQVKGISLSENDIRLVAGTGEPLRRREAGGPALDQDLSTPWDLAWWEGRVVIAMAGIHQLWGLTLDADPALGRLEVLAGTTQEGLRDGPGGEAWLAQPSGLATSADGQRVWVADSETSALRTWSATGLTTQGGTGLFDFGHRDGPAGEARFQHPLGVVELPDGSAAVCDTYNGAIRRYDPTSNRVTTLATGLAEPSDAVVERADDGTARLVVVESAAHRLVRAAIPADAQEVRGPARQTHRPPSTLGRGSVDLTVVFDPPSGQKLDDRWGDPTRLVVSASPPELLLDGAGDGTGLARSLTVATGIPAGTLHVSVQAAACDIDGENPACHLFQQDWGIPVVIDSAGPDHLVLDLRGT